MSNLRERVAEAMWMADPDPYDPADRRPFSEADWEARRNYLAEADAAIALVLEEAARVTDEQSKALLDEAHDQKVWGNGAMSKRALSIADFFSQHAAAIRALKEKSDE